MKTKQHGLAMVMVLVFLILTTLIVTTTLQQNALQFTMIGNIQEQNSAYSHAENILALAENSIDQIRWSEARKANPLDSATHTECKETSLNSGVYDLIDPGTQVGLTISGSTAIIQSWWCENNPADTNGDNFGEAAECDIDDNACPSIPTSGQAPSPNTTTYPAGNIGCGTELYTIRVTFAQQNESSAERVVESKYAVKCLKVGV